MKKVINMINKPEWLYMGARIFKMTTKSMGTQYVAGMPGQVWLTTYTLSQMRSRIRVKIREIKESNIK